MFLPVTESGVDMGVFEVRIEGNAHIDGERGAGPPHSFRSSWSTVDTSAGTEVQRVVVDLARVTFIDSSGVSALCLAKAKLDVDGTVLVLRDVSTQVDTVLRMCGLEREFMHNARVS